MAKMVKISEDLIRKAMYLLMRCEVDERNRAAQLRHERKPERSNRRMHMAQEIASVVDDMTASLDAKEEP